MSKITSDYPSNMCQSMFDNSVSLKAVTMSCEGQGCARCGGQGQSCGAMTLPSRACARCRVRRVCMCVSSTTTSLGSCLEKNIICQERFLCWEVWISKSNYFPCLDLKENTRNLINNNAQSFQTRFGTCCWGNIKYFLT